MENAEILGQEEMPDKLWDKGTLILLRSLGFLCGGFFFAQMFGFFAKYIENR